MDFLQNTLIKYNFQISRSQPQAFIDALKIKNQLSEWVSLAAKGENRIEARERICSCIREKSSLLKLQGLGLSELPPNFNCLLENNLNQLKHLKLDRNLLEHLSDDLKSWINKQKIKISIVAIDSQVLVRLIPLRWEYVEEYTKEYCLEHLWWSREEYRFFKDEAKKEVREYIINQGWVSESEALKQLYQPRCPGLS